MSIGITNKSKQDVRITFDNKTMHPLKWTELTSKMQDKIPMCFKPRPKSASPDSLLLTISGTKLLTIGLAVKNFNHSLFSNSHLNDECEKFNRIFTKKDNNINILIVCATKYSESFPLMNKGQRQCPSIGDKFQYISEVILLDLSKGNIAEFFNLKEDDGLLTIVNDLIEKHEPELNMNKYRNI